MTAHQNPKTVFPTPRLSFRTSRTVIGLLLATVILAILLTFSTIENIDRAENHMRNFLIEKAEAIVHVLEAGSKTSAIHMMRSGNPLHTLLAESSKEDDLVFIRVVDKSGNVIDEAGSPSQIVLSTSNLTSILNEGSILTQLDRDNATFIVSKAFDSQFHIMNMHMMHDVNTTTAGGRPAENTYVISIGLLTRNFDAARKQDVHHAMFMGALLFLVGSAGLYFVFLYQDARVAKSSLANMRLYTESIIESIPVGLITLDSDGRIVSCNHNGEELFGRSFETLREKNILELLPSTSHYLTSNCDTASEHATEYTTAEGQALPIRLSCSSLLNHEGSVIGKVLIIKDMSSIRDMEMQLERSRKLAALGKMATGIAHEIRNPLGTLRGFAQFFGNQATTIMEKQYADLMVSEVDRLNQTVSGLLQFARPRELHLQDISIDDLFAKTIVLMNPDFIDSRLHFTCSRDTGIILNADPDLLLQVLLNLLKNSIHATPSGGEITLLAEEEKSHIRISVTDTGRGMTEKERDQMFDPFFSTGKTGTGLGLAVSHQIIEQHNGFFEVRTAPDNGSTITIILPKKSGEK
ncbi:two-component system, NtrC family, sensor histidine kinase HydH [Desulfopila aestuarii DSM 18488]|uniref:histidine kinase n=2 Tax=Desulfopila aestuarii TaxID=231440 RepID=A0A1M7Y3Y9_9BACT|nr:two-component system, NtrC family, sensor histidine kinase HydH [Desulfopila aestuarii DSM 18488]